MKKIKNNRGLLAVFVILSALAVSCRNGHTPRPRGYYRIDFPEKEYQIYDGPCPYSFDYPVYGEVVKDTDKGTEPCWINIEFPDYKGSIHISYKEVNNNLNKLLEDSYTLAYKHTVKADAIQESLIRNREKSVYGILYNIEGPAASSVQFFLTDSTDNYLRGALYFKTGINRDSLAPVINFFRQDILRFIDSFEWKQSE